MPNLVEASQNDVVDLARECLYRFLAAAITDPYAPGWDALLEPESRQLASQAASLVREEADGPVSDPAFGELPPEHLDLDSITRHLKGPIEAIQAEYDRIFGLVVPRECPPYETEYHRAGDAFFRSQQLADVAGFYRAFGVDPAGHRPERPDHIALELEFMALLMTKQRLAACDDSGRGVELAGLCADAGRKFFAEHLVWWVPAFATGLRRKAQGGYYHDLARALAALITWDRMHYGLESPSRVAEPSLIEPSDEQSGCASCPINV